MKIREDNHLAKGESSWLGGYYLTQIVVVGIQVAVKRG